jgi:hypothetical protein
MEGSSSTPGGELREELRSDAHTITDTARQRLHAEADARKGAAASQAKSVSSALESAAGQLGDSPEWLRSAFRQGAQTLQRFADTIEQKDSRQLTRDVQQLAREHPGVFLAGCAAAGFAAARVLKAGTDGAASAGSGPGQAYAEHPPAAGAMSRAYDPYEPQASTGPSTVFGGMANPQVGEPAHQGDLP